MLLCKSHWTNLVWPNFNAVIELCITVLHYEQVYCIASKAYHRCIIILRRFHTTDIPTLLTAYTVFVRPVLESCTQVWNPQLLKDIRCVEKVQKFFTRLLFKKANLPYVDYGSRLASLTLASLEYRRIFYDLVMGYNIVYELVDLPFDNFFQISKSHKLFRGHSMQLRSVELPVQWVLVS